MRASPLECLKKFTSIKYSRIYMQSSVLKKYTLLVFLILIIMVFLLQLLKANHCLITCETKQVEYICIEDPENQNLTGLENIKPLDIFSEKNENNRRHFRHQQLYIPSKRGLAYLTPSEKKRINLCIKNYPADFKKGHDGFWSGTKQEIRRNHHTYLVPGESIIIDVGGNVGDDAQVFVDTFKPKYYVIMEPLKLLYRGLKQRFRNYTNVVLYNVGLGSRNDNFRIKIEGHDGDASSPFLSSGEGTCSIKVVNATDFFIKLAVGKYKVDLITINCEGCEYDLLETLLSTDLIYKFKHIQFGTHSKLRNLYDPVNRYCQLQELLSRSHELTYQYKFQWETWKLKDVYWN